MNEVLEKPKQREALFVDFVMARIQNDNAFRAALTRADNVDTEYQAWEYLAGWCDLEKGWERKPFALIAATIARARILKDGSVGIGKAIASCYEDGNKSDQAKAKLRRLLSCKSVDEACLILRPLLRLIASKEKARICYFKLLNELIYFGDGERIKQRWAVDFYGRVKDDSVDA